MGGAISSAVGSAACDSATLNNKYAIETTDSTSHQAICAYSRPFKTSNLSTLKLGDTLTYIAGFNIWQTVASPTPMNSGDSNLRTYILTDHAVMLGASCASAILILMF